MLTFRPLLVRAIGLVVYVGIDVNLFENLIGTVETLSVIPVLVLTGHA
jgi:hypothetical protein